MTKTRPFCAAAVLGKNTRIYGRLGVRHVSGWTVARRLAGDGIIFAAPQPRVQGGRLASRRQVRGRGDKEFNGTEIRVRFITHLLSGTVSTRLVWEDRGQPSSYKVQPFSPLPPARLVLLLPFFSTSSLVLSVARQPSRRPPPRALDGGITSRLNTTPAHENRRRPHRR